MIVVLGGWEDEVKGGVKDVGGEAVEHGVRVSIEGERGQRGLQDGEQGSGGLS